MPTIFRTGGLRFVVYPNDHSPAHVHVIGPGWIAVVHLDGPELREVAGRCSRRTIQSVLSVTAENSEALWEGWRRFHG